MDGAVLIVCGAVWAMIALGVAAWGLFWDRARGRKRCGRCWYDMGGVVGLKCPECGRDAKSERGLMRTRRRWGVAAAALSVGAAGGGSAGWMGVREAGWPPLLPEWALVACLESVGEEDDGAGGLHWASFEMKRRFEAGELSGWAMGAAFERQGAVRTVEEWPEGSAVWIAGQTPRWVSGIHYPWAPPLAPEGAFLPAAPGGEGTLGQAFMFLPTRVRDAEWIVSGGIASNGRRSAEVVLRGDLGGRRVERKINVPFRVVALGEGRTAVSAERFRAALRWSVIAGNAERGPIVWCKPDWGAVPEFKSGGVLMKATLVTAEGERDLGVYIDFAEGPPVRETQMIEFPVDQGRDTAGWKVRLEGLDIERPVRWPRTGPWVGTVEIPYADVMRGERR